MDYKSVNFGFLKIAMICTRLPGLVLMVTYKMLTQKYLFCDWFKVVLVVIIKLGFTD